MFTLLLSIVLKFDFSEQITEKLKLVGKKGFEVEIDKLKIKKYFKMKRLLFLLLSICFVSIKAQKTKEIKLEQKFWEQKEGTTALFQKFKGREAVQLNGELAISNFELREGTISIDVFCSDERSFAGVFFHQSTGNREDVYIRQHKSNQVDAVQYTPVFNFESNWQLYNEHQAQVKFNLNQWNTIKVEFNETQAVVFINNNKALNINKLKGISNTGKIGLWSLFPSWISNVRIAHKKVEIKAEASMLKKEENDYIKSWRISESFLIDKIDNLLKTEKSIPFRKVKADENGLLAISKYSSKKSRGSFEKNVEDFVIIEIDVISEIKTTKKISFDFSDKCIVLLNSNEIYRGNNAFKLKGSQFMGHINTEANTLNLPLNKGKNVLRFYVIEKANGWGLKARFHNYQNIKVVSNN